MAFFFVPNFCVYRRRRSVSAVNGARRSSSTRLGVYRRRKAVTLAATKPLIPIYPLFSENYTDKKLSL